MPPRKKTQVAALSLRPEIGRLIAAALPDAVLYKTASSFIGAVLRRAPELAVIDMECPEISGADLILVLRRNPGAAAMLIAAVSAAPRTSREIASGFETGADEYFVLPRDAGLMGPRLLNLLANRQARSGAGPEAEAPLKIGALGISTVSRTVVLKGRELPLTSLEFDMLLYFAGNAGRVVGRGTLIQQVWKADLGVNLRSVDKRIEVLRKKLKGSGVTISTVFGIGYIFKPE
ncbi:MAG: response regulator transcription factor [Elusimicrobia bacterium]|nr:response regulator transcription factor [Elusimicrobiota bacterium]